MRSIDFAEASLPIVLAIDIGSSSVRALLYDADGDQISSSETQYFHTQQITDDGGSESDAAMLFDLLVRCVDEVLEYGSSRSVQISAVGMSCFWHGLLGLDEENSPATPVYMWSDKRSGRVAVELASEVDGSAVHRRTGCRIHSSYWPAKLRWLRRSDPERYAAVRTWVSVTDFVHARLSGRHATSISMASGTGLLNATTLDWDRAMLDAIGVEADRLPPIVDRDDANPDLLSVWAHRWPMLRGVPWFPAIGDGAAANVGSGCVGDDRIALTIGTSAAMRIIVPHEIGADPRTLTERIWCYRLDRNYRALGGALSNAGNVTAWLVNQLFTTDYTSLTSAAGSMEPDSHGLTFLPFLVGERSPSWNDDATGVIHGIRLGTTPAGIFRAALEATAYRLAAIYDDLLLLANPRHEIHANGGAALSSPLWLQIITDTLGHRVDSVDAEAEASARGAALCALESLGILPDLEQIRSVISATYEPDAAHHARYHAARNRQRKLEEAIPILLPHN